MRTTPPPIPDAKDVITKPGDLWILGKHRLLCGDSSKTEDVARVMNGERADVHVLDPPFERDDLPHLHDPCIVFGQMKHARLIPNELFRFERIIDKVTAHRGPTTHIGSRHAFIIQCGTTRTCPESTHTFPSIVTCAERPNHPHEKPLTILIQHLLNWTQPWKLVFDPFAGSGTTLIAAEALGRRCCAIEIDPCHCDVIVKRWEQRTGRVAARETP